MIEIREALGEQHPDLREAREEFAAFLRERNRPEEAARIDERIRAASARADDAGAAATGR